MARQIGIIVAALALCAILAAVLFPVFAQSKAAAKRSSAIAERKQRQLEADMAATDSKATLASYSPQTRAVIRKANLTVQVDNIDASEAKLKEIVRGVGGYVEDADGWDLASTTPSLRVTTRVPERIFEDTLSQFEKLGRRTTKGISAEDVTEQIVDMDARMRTMLVQEEAYRGMLKKVRTLTDSVQLQDKLMQLRGEIESIQGQRKSLAGQADMSSIEVTLEQKANAMLAASTDPNWGEDAWNGALSAVTTAFRGIGVAAIWLAVFSPIWATPLLIAYFVNRWRRRATAKIQPV